MLSNSEIRAIVKSRIERDESPGEQESGSGHLAYVSCKIEEISPPKEVNIDGKKGWEITYKYTVAVESEFGYCKSDATQREASYPRIYRYAKTIVLDTSRMIIKESQKIRL